ncbi:uncharacterized protein LOC108858351 [Raphanus sativus]|uniref:Uncharacterized protein LOC108858351 n=1 Tax=Raphanus sativus TaxID=3726 RepID=A0A9W3DEJ7_RAPSA|nr:uncharacterized protein LOC108858351 [Raphanus sativus]
MACEDRRPAGRTAKACASCGSGLGSTSRDRVPHGPVPQRPALNMTAAGRDKAGRFIFAGLRLHRSRHHHRLSPHWSPPSLSISLALSLCFEFVLVTGRWTRQRSLVVEESEVRDALRHLSTLFLSKKRPLSSHGNDSHRLPLISHFLPPKIFFDRSVFHFQHGPGLLPPCHGCFPSRGYAANPCIPPRFPLRSINELLHLRRNRDMVKIVVSPIFIMMRLTSKAPAPSIYGIIFLLDSPAIQKLITWTWNSTTSSPSVALCILATDCLF